MMGDVEASRHGRCVDVYGYWQMKVHNKHNILQIYEGIKAGRLMLTWKRYFTGTMLIQTQRNDNI